MLQKEIIELIKIAFKDNVLPNGIVRGASFDSIELNEILKNKKWRDLTPELLFKIKDDIPFFSKEGFHYYLPAFLCYILNDFYSADSLSDNMISRLTVIKETDNTLTRNINNQEKRFISDASLFTKLQGKAVKEFLLFLMETYPKEYSIEPIEPQVAIDRYWYKF